MGKLVLKGLVYVGALVVGSLANRAINSGVEKINTAIDKSGNR